MKILLFIRSLEQGGSERQLATLAKGLAERGHDVQVTIFYGGGDNEALLAHTTVRLINLEKTSRWHVLGPLWRLWRVMRTETPDVIYAFLPVQTVLAALLPRFGRKPRLVFGVRAAGMQSELYDALSVMVYSFEVKLSRFADLIVANAAACRSDAITRGMRANRIVVIPNGIDTHVAKPDSNVRATLRRRWNIDEESFVIGMVARLDPMKDHKNFLNAAAKFMRLNADARFVCIGTGTDRYRDELVAYSHSLGLSQHISWIARIDDARAAHNAFDIGTLSSAFGEGFPNVIGEAMACGVPVAATNVGDAATIVSECGEIVPPRRSDRLCESWVRLRQRLADEPNLRTVVRDRIVNAYGIDKLVKQTEEVLTSVCFEDFDAANLSAIDHQT